jgi:hypothetical protein
MFDNAKRLIEQFMSMRGDNSDVDYISRKIKG